jgi:hypothetical protein
MRPFYYSYVGTDHRVRMITDSNPHPYSSSPSDYTNFATGTADYGYTGRTEAAVPSLPAAAIAEQLRLVHQRYDNAHP